MPENYPLKIVFFGTPEFSVKILEALYENGFAPNLIITSPDKPIGRKLKLVPPPVKIWAEKHQIKFSQPETFKQNSTLYSLLSTLSPDLFIVASFGKILAKEIIEIPKFGTLNVHPSLLPKLRGASPIQSAILENEKETGVTIMLMNEKMDEGDILAMSNVKCQMSKIYYKELENELAELGGKLLVETIPKWINGEIEPKPQEHEKATYCKKITKEDGLINLSESPEIIDRKIRAFTPWPGAYTFIPSTPLGINKRLIITQAEVINNALKIKRVKPEGKNEMDFADFLRGNPNEFLKKFL